MMKPGRDIFTGLPLVARNAGRWDGCYRFVRPDGELIERYDFRIRVSLSRDNAQAYRQESRHRGRAWLWYRAGELERYTLIDERRVADDSPLDWPANP